jgi:hypothetical protein
VLYRFVHGVSQDPHIFYYLYTCGSTVQKYVDIVCDVLTSRNKLFNKCISIPTSVWLEDIIEEFCEIIGLSNICGAIDGTHIPLTDRPNWRVTLA